MKSGVFRHISLISPSHFPGKMPPNPGMGVLGGSQGDAPFNDISLKGLGIVKRYKDAIAPEP